MGDAKTGNVASQVDVYLHEPIGIFKCKSGST